MSVCSVPVPIYVKLYRSVQIKIFLFFQYFCRNRTEHFVIVFFILYWIFLSFYAYYFEKYLIDICQLQPPRYEYDREWDSWESDYPVASLSIHKYFINQYFVLRNYFLWSIMQIYMFSYHLCPSLMEHVVNKF